MPASRVGSESRRGSETPARREAPGEFGRNGRGESVSRAGGTEGDSYSRFEQTDQDDDDAESDGNEGNELADDEFSRQQAIYAQQQRNMGLLSQLMDDDQLERHMASRRGTLNKASVRKSVNQHFVMAASGVGKVFVGEMVEKARSIQTERSETGPLRPTHLYEAYRRYQLTQERPGHYPPGSSSGGAGLGRRRRMF
ncbi:hypothetical protein MYAM1_001747 [Malassezia yamatoensis]|uniref:TAFII28-like protein domain-containing protein n=1 Tax=Malassezia yamatoensis TaxID=253288 RepID=A0AAJ6CG56_9BASI|nr:hypothetical protein MYAM1_001747 [Malassezia yamatoensis]